MKVGIFFDPFDQTHIYEILKTLDSLDIDVAAYRMPRKWHEKISNSLQSYLEALTHIMLVDGHSVPEAKWYFYISGYGKGRRLHTSVYRTESDKSDLESCAAVLNDTAPVLRNSDELRNIYTQEKDTWRDEGIAAEAREELISKGYGLTDSEFCRAVLQGDQKAVHHFLDLGFSPETTDERGIPLLYHAVKTRQKDLSKLLIDKGASVNAVSGDRGNSPVMEAAGIGEEEILHLLLDAGADTDIQNKNGQTALMLAVGEGRSTIVDILLQNGAKLDLKDHLGMTALKYAKLFNFEDIVKLIEERSSG